jgi:mevalonate kinase
MRLDIEPADDLQIADGKLGFERFFQTVLRDHGFSQQQPLTGRAKIHSTIPTGAGLGSSAALCVLFARWVSVQYALKSSAAEIHFLASLFENFFHGRSSGMDIAAVMTEGAVVFRRCSKLCFYPVATDVAFNLPLSFHDTGLRASTQTCIFQVKDCFASDVKKALLLDQTMQEASLIGQQGLAMMLDGQRSMGLECLSQCMRLSHEVFRGWGLIPKAIEAQVVGLYKQGAMAVKLTGSGLGGFLVALWPKQPV